MKLNEEELQKAVSRVHTTSKANVVQVVRDNIQQIRDLRAKGIPILKIAEAISDVLQQDIKPKTFASTFSKLNRELD